MQNRLPMKSDHVDPAAIQFMFVQKRSDSLNVCARHQFFGFRERAWTRIPIGERNGVRELAPKHGAIVVRVRAIAGRAKRSDVIAVGFDQRNVDTIQRRSAHQADGSQHTPLIG